MSQPWRGWRLCLSASPGEGHGFILCVASFLLSASFNEAVWVRMPLPAFCAPAALRVKPCSCDSPALPSSQVTSPTPFPLPVPCHPCRLSPIPVPRTGPFSCLGGPAEAVPCLEHLSSLCTGQAPLFLPCSACPGSPPSSSLVFPSVYCRGGTSQIRFTD